MAKIRKRDLQRLGRSLRFRLMASYALLFLILLVGTAEVFRRLLWITLRASTEDTLTEEWTAIHGAFLRIEPNPEIDNKYAANWYYDKDDTDETTMVFDLKKVLLVADEYGNPIPDGETHDPSISATYEDLGAEKPAEIRAYLAKARTLPKPQPLWAQRWSSKGEPFLLRSGLIWDEKHRRPFYVSIGISRAKNQKILNDYSSTAFIVVVPVALILGSYFGWVLAGRSLRPVRDVAQAAQRISGSNLSLRIPTRQADDELDYLIVTFNRMIDRLESSFQQMKQFSTDVSHELRTPITAIRGQLEVALFTAKTTDQYREAMFNALQDIDRLSQIVRALLLLSQAESGQIVLQKTQIDVGELIRDLAEQFQIPAEAAGVRLTADAPSGVFLNADRVQIERMITNLLSNAVKFTPENGRVRVSAQAGDDWVEIVVADTGRGIPPEHLPHIFDRFYRVTGSGTAPVPEQGLGLGLSFVAWIARAHGGAVDVDSSPGNGTRFTIKLPTVPREAGAMELAGQPAAS